MRNNSSDLFILPMVGFTQSFNISVSVAIALTYMRTFGTLHPDLSEEEKINIQFEWLVGELPSARPNVRQLLESKGYSFEDL